MQVRREEEGASAGGQRERVAAGRGSAAIRGDYVLPCSPPRSLSLRLTREREAGVRGSWVWPRTIANANAPTSLSNLLLFGLRGIGGSTDEGRPYPGEVQVSGRPRMTPACPPRNVRLVRNPNVHYVRRTKEERPEEGRGSARELRPALLPQSHNLRPLFLSTGEVGIVCLNWKEMASRLPKQRKPPETLWRRNAPESWTSLPAAGCSLATPKWPFARPSNYEADLWALPIAEWWHEQRIEPTIVATYVRIATSKPEHASCLKLMAELGLTPASPQRLRLIVEAPEEEAEPRGDPYAHLRVAG
jgi:hypothetical protein